MLHRLANLVSLLIVAAMVLMASSFGFGQQELHSKFAFDSPGKDSKERSKKREEWFLRGRTTEDGRVAVNLRFRAHQQKMRMRRDRRNQLKALAAQLSGAPLTSASWSPLGPSPILSDSTTPAHSGGDQDYG